MLHLSTASSPITITLPAQSSSPPAPTHRELVVLALVVDGLTNPQIAERLTNSPRTVQSHVQSLMRKFGVTTRTQLAVHALRSRIVPLELLDPMDGAGIVALPA